MKKCLGCLLANNKIKTNVFLNHDLFNIIYDHDPIAKNHLLIIPKRHMLNFYDLNHDESKELKKIIKKIKSKLKLKNYTIMINDGKINELSHIHIHFIPRKLKDKFTFDKKE